MVAHETATIVADRSRAERSRVHFMRNLYHPDVLRLPSPFTRSITMRAGVEEMVEAVPVVEREAMVWGWWLWRRWQGWLCQ
jgi:hypothetical protein